MNRKGFSPPKSLYTVSLGCPKNLVDSEIMLGQLREMGIETAKSPEQADVILVNTCGFIHSAKRESVDAILDVAQYKQEGSCRALIVSGCLVQRYRNGIAGELPEVDAFLGPDDCGKIGSIVQEVWQRVNASNQYPLLSSEPVSVAPGAGGRPRYLYDHQAPRMMLTPRHYAYVKISEGCDNPCKFCIIPQLRGAFRSRPMESIVAEAEKLASEGVVEIILIAQDLTDYGLDLYKARKLAVLLEKLNAVQGLRWIRLLYAYPAHTTEDLIDAIAGLPKICRYLDMPIQHLADEMLLRMGRRLGKQQTKALIARLRERVPGLALRTSLIVGMPGETESVFAELLAEVREIRFERLGVFTYSREEGTAAYRMGDQVPERVKNQRRAKVMALQQKISGEINKSLLGSQVEVLLDGVAPDAPGFYTGRTQWDAPGIDNTVLVKAANLAPGDFIGVKITHATAYDLEGIPANDANLSSAQPAYTA